jgi:hypothetical protein
LALERLANATPAATAYDPGFLLYEAILPTVASVIAVNTTEDMAYAYIYVVPFDADSSADWAALTYNLPITGYNSYETFRFAFNTGDSVYVAGSAGISYYLHGTTQ